MCDTSRRQITPHRKSIKQIDLHRSRKCVYLLTYPHFQNSEEFPNFFESVDSFRMVTGCDHGDQGQSKNGCHGVLAPITKHRAGLKPSFLLGCRELFLKKCSLQMQRWNFLGSSEDPLILINEGKQELTICFRNGQNGHQKTPLAGTMVPMGAMVGVTILDTSWCRIPITMNTWSYIV